MHKRSSMQLALSSAKKLHATNLSLVWKLTYNSSANAMPPKEKGRTVGGIPPEFRKSPHCKQRPIENLPEKE